MSEEGNQPDGDKFEIDIVLLGDASVGKSCLAVRFVTDEYENQEPTVGVSGFNKTIITDSGDTASVVIWDYTGQERYTRLSGDHLRGNDGCLMVFNQFVRDSFTHLGLWHDEYLQNNASSSEYLPPPFVLVGSKSDEKAHVINDNTHKDDELTDTVKSEEVFGWCGDEYVDKFLWGKDSIVSETAIPYYETSALTGENVDKAFMDLIERGIYRQRRLRELSNSIETYHLIPPSVFKDLPQECEASIDNDASVTGVIDIKISLLGDASTGKTCFLRQCKSEQFEERYEPSTQIARTRMNQKLLDKEVHLEVWDIPGAERLGPLTAIRGSHACIITAAANSLKSLERVNLWKEIFLRESGVRDVSSVLFVLLYTKADFDDALADVPSKNAIAWAASHDFEFVSVNATEYSDAMKAIINITQLSLSKRLDSIVDRVEAQLESAELSYNSQQLINGRKLERERQTLFKKHMGSISGQGYLDGKVWSGTKEGTDTFIDTPVYSFPIKSLRGDPIQVDTLSMAQHLPLLLEKISDLRNDLAKMEQKHKDEVESLRSSNLLEISTLRRDLDENRAMLEEEKQKNDELRWELRLIWQSLESK